MPKALFFNSLIIDGKTLLPKRASVMSSSRRTEMPFRMLCSDFILSESANRVFSFIQIHATYCTLPYGIPAKNIFIDKQNGKDFERLKYKHVLKK